MQHSLTLHIGTPKSGTTYLQAVLSADRRDLARAGILYPGERYLPHAGINQQPAVYAVGRRFITWVGPDARDNAVRYYHRLCEEASAYRGRVLISAESLAFFDVREIRSLLSGLHADLRQVHVVITARDLGRVLPSIWQQNVKNGSTEPLGSYLASVAALRGTAEVPLWTAFGLPGLVRRWQDVVGADRVCLVTAPHGSGDALWHRFRAAAGLPPSTGTAAGSPGTRVLRLADRNHSLTMPQAELLRRVNLELRARRGAEREVQALRHRILQAWMSAGDGLGSRIAVPAALEAAVHRWAAEDRDALLANGVRVVGDLADLVPRVGTRSAGDEPYASSDLLGEATRSLLLLATEAPPVTPHSGGSAARRPLRRIRRAILGATTGRASVGPADPAPPAVVDLSDPARPAAGPARLR